MSDAFLDRFSQRLLRRERGTSRRDSTCAVEADAAFQAVDQGGALPAIAVTAYAGPADRQRVLAAGFKMHLEKPVAPLALAAAIARVAAGTA
jgi:CheY-like chemotaxis protein